jgi:hypothetical protein
MVDANNLNIIVSDDDSEGSEETTDHDAEVAATKQFRRDEVSEVRKMSSKDTNRLHLWRVVVTSVLLLTALAVTLTTYTLLQQQEEENFQTAVRLQLVHNKSGTGAAYGPLFTHFHIISSFSLLTIVRTICAYRR